MSIQNDRLNQILNGSSIDQESYIQNMNKNRINLSIIFEELIAMKSLVVMFVVIITLIVLITLIEWILYRIRLGREHQRSTSLIIEDVAASAASQNQTLNGSILDNNFNQKSQSTLQSPTETFSSIRLSSQSSKWSSIIDDDFLDESRT
ncbi:elongation factor 1-alpha [Sarcoptes scabiei]|nr:elongation factor 1-alpha [Sarcoptes scabiei]